MMEYTTGPTVTLPGGTIVITAKFTLRARRSAPITIWKPAIWRRVLDWVRRR